MVTQPQAPIYPRQQSVTHRVSRCLLPLGAVAFVAGLFIYLLGNVRIGFIQWIYQNIILNQGIARLFGASPAIVSQSVTNFSKNAVFIMLAGLVLGGNGIMLRIQPWERYKDALCVQPALILLILFVYYPLAELIRLSLTNSNLMVREYQFLGLDNYNWLLYRSGAPYFTESLMITGWYILWETVSTVCAGLLLALLFSGFQRTRRVMRALISFPGFLTITSSALLFIWMLSTPYGVLNHILSLFRFAGPDWLHDESMAFPSLLLFSIWRGIGFGMMVYCSAMRSIPREYYEAAELEGADRMRRFRVVTLPSLKPTIHYLFSISLISSARAFETFDVMKSGRPDGAATVFPLLAHTFAFEDSQIGRASTVSVMYFLMLLVITLATMHFTLRPTEE